MFQQFLEPQLQQSNLGLVWFQQYGATAHAARNSLAVLREMFPVRLISRCAEVFKHRQRTLEALKHAIRHEVGRVPQQMLRSVMQNIRTRLHHLHDVLFQT